MFLVRQVSELVENLNIWIFSDNINVINVRLRMVVLLIEFYLFIPLSLTMAIVQGQSSVKQFQERIVCSYLIKFKLCRIVKYVK